MKLKERLLDLLKNHMHKLIDGNDFGLLESMANFSKALHTDKWENLPYDEQMFWLEKIHGIYSYFIRDGDPEFSDNPDINKILEIIGWEIKALKRKL
jgi:hypothetical protein